MTAAFSGSAAAVAVIPTKELQATGSSTSTTPGTAIASIEGTGGKRLINIQAMGTGAASSNIRFTVTYDDDTTETWDTTSGTNPHQILGGLTLRIADTIAPALTFTSMATKTVKSIAATTLGAGSSARVAVLRAQEVSPQ